MLQKLKKTIRGLRKQLKYGGNERLCPICNNTSKQFIDFGIIPRTDAKCPFCGALERHRFFWLYMERKTAFKSNPPRKALHIAPEAILEDKLRPLIGAGYLTADYFEPDVDLKMDITDIQFPDSSFDFIYCSHVLEHVPDDRKAMREFQRVLTDEGIAILLVPITADETFEDPTIEDPKERLRLFGQEDHVRRYGPDYVSRLQEAGFAVETVRREDFLRSDEIENMGITAVAGELYICRKSG
jgi:SAM-dependent methyltransferase